MMLKIDGVGLEAGWSGMFTRNQAEGAITNGTRIAKTGSKPGDAHPDGTPGLVLGSFGPLPAEEFPETKYFYFVEWEPLRRVACGIAGHRIVVLP